MSGILAYAEKFRRGTPYGGGVDGVHHEIEGEDFVSVSNTSWEAMRSLCEGVGIPKDSWPHFHSSIDLEIGEIEAKNVEILEHIRNRKDMATDLGPIFAMILKFIGEKKMFYFSETD